jgi:hypothetical protein
LKRKSLEAEISLNELCLRMLDHADAPSSSLSASLLPAIRSAFAKDLVGVLLFGSAARGTEQATSDIDLLIVLAETLPITRALYAQWDAAIRDHEKVSPHFVRLPPSIEGAGSIWFEAAMDGIVLWEQGNAVSGFLVAVRRAIAEGKIRRRTVHGHPYWVDGEGKDTHAQ